MGVPAAWCGFPEEWMRDLRLAIPALARQSAAKLPDESSTLFIYCAAKGDIRILDCPGDNLPPPVLSSQADIAAESLGLAKATRIAVSNACASGSIALETAWDLLEHGPFTEAIIVGYDSLSRFVATGFHSLGALSPDGARPFDKNRNGLTLGEGAALAVVSRREALPGEIVIAGCGSTNDANHRTGPSRTGDGLLAAASRAMRQAGIGSADLGAVKCHGTATPYNDAMEAKAIAGLFGAGTIAPCVSLKGALGHTSGASSLLEVLVMSECLKRREIPGTAGFTDLGVDEPIPVSSSSQAFVSGARSALCLSAGFGGVNAAVVLREVAR